LKKHAFYVFTTLKLQGMPGPVRPSREHAHGGFKCAAGGGDFVADGGRGSIKDRLLDAYCGHLADLEEADLPADMRRDFGEMIVALHRVRPLPGDDIIKASVRKLSNEDACRYASFVVKLYGLLAGAKYHITRNTRSAPPLAKLLSAENTAANS
jgi:hypothetical protein